MTESAPRCLWKPSDYCKVPVANLHVYWSFIFWVDNKDYHTPRAWNSQTDDESQEKNWECNVTFKGFTHPIICLFPGLLTIPRGICNARRCVDAIVINISNFICSILVDLIAKIWTAIYIRPVAILLQTIVGLGWNHGMIIVVIYVPHIIPMSVNIWISNLSDTLQENRLRMQTSEWTLSKMCSSCKISEQLPSLINHVYYQAY